MFVGSGGGGATELLVVGVVVVVVVVVDVVVVVVFVVVLVVVDGVVLVVPGVLLVPWSWISSMIPKTIRAIRTRTDKPQTISPTGLRYHAIGSVSSSKGSRDSDGSG